MKLLRVREFDEIKQKSAATKKPISYNFRPNSSFMINIPL
jgi:hypothetical protein